MTQPLPMVDYPIARTRSVEEARLIQTQFIGLPVEIEHLDAKVPFSWSANRSAFDRLGIMASEYGASTRARELGPGKSFHLVIATAGRGRVTQGGRSAELRPAETAAVCSPSAPIELAVQSGYRGRVIAIPAPVLEAALSALVGLDRKVSPSFDLSVDLSRTGGKAALRWLEWVTTELDCDTSGLLLSPLAQNALTDVLMNALLCGLPHDYTARLTGRRPSAEPAHLRRAEDYLAANAHRHITLPELAAAAGIGVRALETAFRKYRCCSPMSFLRQRRLDLARRRLLALPATSVTEVALVCGFEHLGRFSVGYRTRFGESPSMTLRRTRRRNGG